MSHTDPNQLKLAEKLFDEGEPKKALEILNNAHYFQALDLQQRSYYQFIKGLILMYQLKFEDLIELGKELLREGKNRNDNLKSFDGIFFIIYGLIEAEKMTEAEKLLEEAENIFKLISNVPKNVLNQREVRLNLLKTWISFQLAKLEIAEKSLEWVFNQELPCSFEILWAYVLKGQIEFYLKRNTETSLTYFKRVFSIAKEIKFKHFWVGISHGFSGNIYISIGDYDNCLIEYTKALEILKGFKSFYLDSAYLTNIGCVYWQKGEYDLALKSWEDSLSLSEKKAPLMALLPLGNLVEVALIKGDVKLAKNYFHRLENIYNQNREEHLEVLYLSSKAVILERSSRIRDKVKAEELFKQIIGIKTMYFETKIHAYIHLCDLLFSEYQISNDEEILDEINQNVIQLLDLAERSHSYIVFCETFILQAKLALLNINIKAARRFLTQAQKIADSYGIKRLAMKISFEHDNLLKEMDKWETFSESKASLAERIELARFDDQLKIMLKKRLVEIPDMSKEDPVMLLILTEGGTLLFSKKFVEDFSFEEHILGGFLTTINYIISELFSEGLDRAVFGPFTLLMMPIQPFLACYIFKGDSYFAHHKIKDFIDSIQKNNIIWQSLHNFSQMSKSVQINDIPSLELLITEIFC